jgi:hypothetical protein
MFSVNLVPDVSYSQFTVVYGSFCIFLHFEWGFSLVTSFAEEFVTAAMICVVLGLH